MTVNVGKKWGTPLADCCNAPRQRGIVGISEEIKIFKFIEKFQKRCFWRSGGDRRREAAGGLRKIRNVHKTAGYATTYQKFLPSLMLA